jgi:hypothetical protein
MIDPTVSLLHDSVCMRVFNRICKEQGFTKALEYLKEKIEDKQLCREHGYEEIPRRFKGA